MNNYGHYPRGIRKVYSYAFFHNYFVTVQPSRACHRRRMNWYGVYHSKAVGIERRFIERRNRPIIVASWNSEGLADA